jgi:hypothetical protein
MSAGDRIEAFAVEIGHLDRVPSVAQCLECRVLQSRRERCRIGMNIDQQDVHSILLVRAAATGDILIPPWPSRFLRLRMSFSENRRPPRIKSGAGFFRDMR